MHLISDTPLRIGMLGLDTSHVILFRTVSSQNPTEPDMSRGEAADYRFPRRVE